MNVSILNNRIWGKELVDSWVRDGEESKRLFMENMKEDHQQLRAEYPELSHWAIEELDDAWRDFSFDVQLVWWADPYRTDWFFGYLLLVQEGNLPDCGGLPACDERTDAVIKAATYFSSTNA